MAALLAMGGYAVFVWPAYAISFLVLAVLVIASLKARNRARAAARQLEAEAERNGDAKG